MKSRLRDITLMAYSRSRKEDQPAMRDLNEEMKQRIENFAREVIEELAVEMDRTNFSSSLGEVHIVLAGTKVGRRLRLLAGIEDALAAPQSQ